VVDGNGVPCTYKITGPNLQQVNMERTSTGFEHKLKVHCYTGFDQAWGWCCDSKMLAAYTRNGVARAMMEAQCGKTNALVSDKPANVQILPDNRAIWITQWCYEEPLFPASVYIFEAANFMFLSPCFMWSYSGHGETPATFEDVARDSKKYFWDQEEGRSLCAFKRDWDGLSLDPYRRTSDPQRRHVQSKMGMIYNSIAAVDAAEPTLTDGVVVAEGGFTNGLLTFIPR